MTNLGDLAEWINAPVLKTDESKGSVSSNLTVSASALGEKANGKRHRWKRCKGASLSGFESQSLRAVEALKVVRRIRTAEVVGSIPIYGSRALRTRSCGMSLPYERGGRYVCRGHTYLPTSRHRESSDLRTAAVPRRIAADMGVGMCRL